MNVAFFENRVFADAIKLSSSWIRVALNPMTGAKRENGHNDTQIHIRQHHLATDTRTGSASQGLPATTRSYEKDMEVFPLSFQEGLNLDSIFTVDFCPPEI